MSERIPVFESSPIEGAVSEHGHCGGRDLIHEIQGSLIIIGGTVLESAGETAIYTEVSRHARESDGPLLVITTATTEPDETARDYRQFFADLGVSEIQALHIARREDAFAPSAVEMVARASLVHFSGGDQLRITSQMGNSAVMRKIRERYATGLTVSGSSAGAAAMGEAMLIYGSGNATQRLAEIGVAHGLALLPRTVIDTHFAQRGRIPRLLLAVAENPMNLGLGIDVNTAIMVEHAHTFRVLGDGGVYVIDGASISHADLTATQSRGGLSIVDARLHLLTNGSRFDLQERKPLL